MPIPSADDLKAFLAGRQLPVSSGDKQEYWETLLNVLTFPDAMRPFCIEGQKGDGGVPYVFICTPLLEDRQHLKHIGTLRPKPRWVLLRRVGDPLPYIAKYTCKYLEQQFFENSPWWYVSGSLGLYVWGLYRCDPVLPRMVGEARVPRTWHVPAHVVEYLLTCRAKGYIVLYDQIPAIEQVR